MNTNIRSPALSLSAPEHPLDWKNWQEHLVQFVLELGRLDRRSGFAEWRVVVESLHREAEKYGCTLAIGLEKNFAVSVGVCWRGGRRSVFLYEAGELYGFAAEVSRRIRETGQAPDAEYDAWFTA